MNNLSEPLSVFTLKEICTLIRHSQSWGWKWSSNQGAAQIICRLTFWCEEPWGLCLLSLDPPSALWLLGRGCAWSMTKGRHPRHTTNGRDHKDRHWLSLHPPCGAQLVLIVPTALCSSHLTFIFSSQWPACGTSSSRNRCKDSSPVDIA